MDDLPIVSVFSTCSEILNKNKILLLSAEPGAGKTTQIPLALFQSSWLNNQKILMLEPRRLAAVSAVKRIAELLNEKPGKTVGWRIGGDTLVGPTTRIEVITEGILTRMLLDKPDLPGVGLVLFDEFHERTIHGDLGLALCLEAREALRPDLRLGLMSATLAEEDLIDELDNCEIVNCKGRTFPVQVEHWKPHDRETLEEGIARLIPLAWDETKGDILVFLPGWAEIQRVKDLLERRGIPEKEELRILHGTMAFSKQSEVLNPNREKRTTILSSAVAETSITLPGVTLVIDSGYSRINTFDPRTGMDHLITQRVSSASATQRAGRAGRTGPGRCWCLWDSSITLESKIEPEILRADLTELVLDCALWGVVKPDLLKWITPPGKAAWNKAKELLASMEVLNSSGYPTETGRGLAVFGVHPRLGVMMLKAKAMGCGGLAAACAALLEERDAGSSAQESNFLLLLENFLRNNSSSNKAKEKYELLMVRLNVKVATFNQNQVCSLLLSSFPDKFAIRQGDVQNSGKGLWAQFQMANGRSVRVWGSLAREKSIVVLQADAGGEVGTVHSAAPIDEILARQFMNRQSKTHLVLENPFENPRLWKIKSNGVFLLEKTGLSLTQPETLSLWIDALQKASLDVLPWDSESTELLQRIRFWMKYKESKETEWEAQTLLAESVDWLQPYLSINSGKIITPQTLKTALKARLGWDKERILEKEVPTHIQVPSGVFHKIVYQGSQSPILEVRIQEVFGWAESPKICGIKVTLHLLSPARRPLQITQDLQSFWATGYEEVRKEMRGRYPKHYWPEDPLTAEATTKTKRGMQ